MTGNKSILFSVSLVVIISVVLFGCVAKTEEQISPPTPTLAHGIELPPTYTPKPSFPSPLTPTNIMDPGPAITETALAPTPLPQESYWMIRMSGSVEFSWGQDSRDNGIFLIGGYDVNNDSHVIMKLDEYGRHLWEKVFDPETFVITSIYEKEDGYILLTGVTEHFRFIVFELDASGNIINEKMYQFSSPVMYEKWKYIPLDFPIDYDFNISGSFDIESDHIAVLTKTEDGGILAAGTTRAERTAPDGNRMPIVSGIWTVKFNEEGKVLWQRYFRRDVMYVLDVKATLDGGVVFVGQDYTDTGTTWITKFDHQGELVFWKTYSLYYYYSFSLTSDGGFILVGRKEALRLGPTGDVIWVKAFNMLGVTSYMYEREQGGYILTGTVPYQGNDRSYVAFLNEDAEIPDCTHLFTKEYFIEERFPPSWLDHSSSLYVFSSSYPAKEVDKELIQIGEMTQSPQDICRYFVSEEYKATETGIDDMTFAPILVGSYGIILGGSQGGMWIDAETSSSLIVEGKTYLLFDRYGSLMYELRGDSPKPAEQGRCQGFPSVHFDTKFVYGSYGISIGGSWDILPRVPDRIPYDTQFYVTEVKNYLKAKGLSRPRLDYPYMYRIDLDNDDSDEVILVGTNKSIDSPYVKAGDFSVVLLRTVSAGNVVTLSLAEQINVKDKPGEYLEQYSILGIFDLDGDSKMEIILEVDDGENGELWVYEFKGDTIEQVLSLGCMTTVP
jgi:hypothetical protein